MSKVATIASLVRAAARTEDEFSTTVQSVVEESDHARTAEFFDKMNIPRSVAGDKTTETLAAIIVTPDQIGDYEEEKAIADGILDDGVLSPIKGVGDATRSSKVRLGFA